MVYKIIPLGSHCGISFVLRRLKLRQETGLFEWFRNNHISSITNVIKLLAQDPTLVKMVSANDLVCINDSSIYSAHYKINEFPAILERRIQRFLSEIKNTPNTSSVDSTKSETDSLVPFIPKQSINELHELHEIHEILFVRDLLFGEAINLGDVNAFIAAIKQINPDLKFKILLVSIIRNPRKFREIKGPNIIHKYIIKNQIRDRYWREPSDLTPWKEIFADLATKGITFVYQ